jgi:hypothetical protein
MGTWKVKKYSKGEKAMRTTRNVNCGLINMNQAIEYSLAYY